MEITLWWKWLIILNFNIIMKIHKINKSQMHPVMHVCPLLDIVSSKVFHDMLLFYCICCNQVCNWKTLAVRLHVHFTCCSTWCFACVWCSVSVETVLPLVPAVLDTDLPSRDMPTARHFCSLQCWQRFRLVRSIRQFFWRGHEYAALLCWLLLKKPYRPERRTERGLVNPCRAWQ